MAELFGGLETGGTWCVCAAGTSPGDLVAHEQFPTADPQRTVQRIAAFFTRVGPVRALGVGSFGPLELDPTSPDRGTITTTPKSGWQNVPLAALLRQALGVPVVIDTDVAAAAVGEHLWGAGAGVEDLAYLTVGTGIGAGILVGGVPVHGLVHPEVGHLRVPHDLSRDPFPGVCPVHGDCWEGLASGPAMAERWKRRPQDLPRDHEAWELEAEYLALGILAIVSVISPRRIIAGGGVFEQPGLREATRGRLRELLGGYLRSPLLTDRIDEYLVAPDLGDLAGVMGALALARRAFSASRA